MNRRPHTTKAFALLALTGLLACSAHAIEVGQPAPAIDLPGQQGTVQLSSYKGKTVYLDFWASWCGPCKQSFPWMNDMQRKYGARGLQVVAINLDAKRGDADQFLAQNPATVALAFDSKGESARRMGVKGMPTSLLVGADGKVLLVHQGFRNEDRTELEAKLVAALAASGGKTP